ncbi:MAG: hypothetical protein U0586_10695 [Candidatus Brocadiaceae bacterium]
MAYHPSQERDIEGNDHDDNDRGCYDHRFQHIMNGKEHLVRVNLNEEYPFQRRDIHGCADHINASVILVEAGYFFI